MIEGPQLVIAGKTWDALDTIYRWAKNRGAGTAWTVKNGQQALELRGMIKTEINEVRLMAERAGLDIFNDTEVCKDGDNERGIRRETKTTAIKVAA